VWTLSSFPSSSSSAPSPPLSEAELADIWQQRAYRNHYLVDCCGRHLKVVFPGRRWGGPGPDFVGAVLAQSDGTLFHGDIELHLRASSWVAHRHASDPAYANVILHVVQAANTMVLDGQGEHVPTVQLELLGPGARGRWRPKPERVPCLRQARSVLQVVEAAGRERFQARVARFEGDLSMVEPDQVLWRGVAEALGFGRNARPFGQLAEAVPWSQAAAVVVDRGPVGVAGLLLGAAGLLAEATLPEAHAWRALQRSIGVRPMLRAASWDRGQSRAANAPEVRCRGLAELAAGWRRGPAAQVLEQVTRAGSQRHPRLWPLARVAPWIGPGRAQVIAVNVLLPFAAAAGAVDAGAIYERVAGEPSNRVLRYMAQQLQGDAAAGIRFRGACHQQGLLQLFQATCASRACERCPARAGGSLQQAGHQPRLSKD
jgi:uncharacterized protein DUF2851